MADYFINEGNKIGYMPTEFGLSGDGIALSEKKIVADGDIKKGDVVVVSDELKVKVATATTGKFVLGVAMFNAKDGEPVSVETEGLFALTSGAAITAPAQVTAGDGGKVITATTDSKVIGLALTDASAADKPVIVKFSI